MTLPRYFAHLSALSAFPVGLRIHFVPSKGCAHVCPGDHTTLEPTSLFFLPLIDQRTQLSVVSPTLLCFLLTSYLPLS